MEKQTAAKDSKSREIIRFLVIGIVATICDFVTKLVASGLMKNIRSEVSIGVSTICGFIVGVIVNYVFSVLWVFQNVADKGAAKTQKKFWLFVFLGAIGLGISEAIFYGSYWIFIKSSGIDIDGGSKTPMKIFSGDWSFLWNLNFWMYFIVFCISTLIVLVWNYKSRKKWIFIEPKKEQPVSEIKNVEPKVKGSADDGPKQS